MGIEIEFDADQLNDPQVRACLSRLWAALAAFEAGAAPPVIDFARYAGTGRDGPAGRLGRPDRQRAPRKRPTRCAPHLRLTALDPLR